MAKGHAPRRKNAGPRGSGLHQPRKLYPYIRAEQRKKGLAPKMGNFINNWQRELEDQGNRVLSGPGKMVSSQARHRMGTRWRTIEKQGTKTAGQKRALNRGYAPSEVKAALADSHAVSFGADPHSK